MPATTPKFKLPYPVGGDRVSTLDDTGKALATRLEAVLDTRAAAAETSQWANSNLQLVKIGNIVHAVGTIRNATHAAAGTHNNILVIPAGYRPASTLYGDVCAISAVSYTAGAGTPYATDVAVSISTGSGNLSMRCERNTTWAVVSASWAVA